MGGAGGGEEGRERKEEEAERSDKKNEAQKDSQAAKARLLFPSSVEETFSEKGETRAEMKKNPQKA